MKGFKGDGGKQTHSKGGPLTAETEPLFPRLHVNQTEKAGPRAPPRNKMALYEQFTIPSHRFVPSNRTASIPYSQQYHQYAYSSYHMPPTAPYPSVGHDVQAHIPPCYATSSGSSAARSAVSHDVEPQRVSGGQRVGIPGHVGGFFEVKGAQKQGSRKTSSVRLAACPSSSSRNTSEGTSKDGTDFCVPTVPLRGVHVSGKTTPKVSRNPGKQDGRSTCYVMNLAVVSQAESFEGRPPESSTTCDTGLAVVEHRSRPLVAEISGENGKAEKKYDEGNLEQVAKPSCEACSPRPRGHLSQHSETQGMEHMPELGAEGQGLLPNATEAVPLFEDEQESLNSNSHCAQIKSTGSHVEEMKVSPQSLDGLERYSSPRDELSFEVAEVQDREIASAVNVSSARKAKSGISGHIIFCQQVLGKGSGESPYEASSSICSIRPKDVIHAVGQQKFWRARKAMLRQQRIFSDQVFELHKLIKVQQLLVESPNAFIDEGKTFEELACLPCYDATDEEEGHEDEVRGPVPLSKEASEDQPLETGHHFELPCNRGGWRPSLNIDSVTQGGVHQLSPAFYPGGVSAWGYPSFYPPYNSVPGICPPVVGPLPQLLSFGFPLDQGQKVLANAPSIHNRTAVSGHQLQKALCQKATVGSLPPDLLGSWYAMQHAYHQGLFATGMAAGPSTGSIASINNQPELSVHGMQYQWAVENAVLHSHADGQKSTADQGQESSPSVHVRINANATPSSAASKKSQGLLDCSGDDGRTTNGIYNGRLGMTKLMDSEELRWPMKWKEGDEGIVSVEYCDEQMDDERSPDHSLNALNLFPLVPSMNPDVRSDGSRNKPGGGWQGRAIKVTPRPAVAASESAAEILLSLQQERQ